MNFRNLQKEKAELIRIKGVIFFYKVDYALALEYFIQSRDIYQQIGNKSGEASALSNIALVYGKQGLLKKALKMEIQVLETRKQIGDSIRIAAGYNNLGVAYQDIEMYNEALNNFRSAVSVLESINETEELDLYYNNIGFMYMKLNMYDSVPYFSNKSLLIGKQYNNKQMICNSLALMGDYFIAMQDYTKAIDYLNRSLKIAKEIGIVYEIGDVSESLCIAYEKVGNFSEAYKMLLLSKQMADSANNVETMQAITKIESSLEYEKELELQKLEHDKKELQNELTIHNQKQFRNIALVIILASLIWLYLLYKNYRRKSNMNIELIVQKEEIIAQKEEIESQRDEIGELNHTRERFFAIIAHDLRNPLGGIYKLEEILVRDFDSLDKEKIKQYTEQIYHSSELAYNLLENLLKWASVQLGTIGVEPITIELSDIINETVGLHELTTNQKHITVKYNNNSCIAFADKQMITTIIRNLFSNAVKFTPKGGNIEISTVTNNNMVTVCIKDSGIGIATKDLELLFDTGTSKKDIGNSKEKGTGLGLILCKDFAERNGGEIWVESTIEVGSSFFFTVPVKLLQS